ncbi:MAG: NAD-dependent epimerase/dehydratase family protein [Chloroflexi bacterium]|nr:NAD-dependent epimerase/dehydratase family protein [Chloroflexota bacterium]
MTPVARTAQIAGKRILLTGGAGFIASHLVGLLAGANELTLLDNLRRNALDHLGPLPPGVVFIHGDILKPDTLESAVRDQDIVVHLAAIAGTRSVGLDVIRTMEVNFVGTRMCLEASARAGVTRFVCLSTSEVYGIHASDASEDRATPIPPATEGRWAYAASKLAAEHLALAYDRAGLVPSVVIRPFNVYGPRQVGEGAIHDMVAAAVAGRPITVRGTGHQVRSWCFVEDFVDAVASALAVPDARGEIINVGNPRASATTMELAETVARLAGSGIAISREPALGPDVESRTPSIAKARRVLGFEPKVDLEEGVGRTIEWQRSLASGRPALA